MKGFIEAKLRNCVDIYTNSLITGQVNKPLQIAQIHNRLPTKVILHQGHIQKKLACICPWFNILKMGSFNL